MSVDAASSYRPADTRTTVALATAAVVAFVGAWLLMHEWFYARDQIIDTPIYQRYGDAIVRGGQVPYRELGLEYPPGALPAFVLPSLLRSPAGDFDAYRHVFEALMLLCGLAMILAVLATLSRLRAPTRRTAAALGLAAVAPLLLGSVVLSRFDLWPAALTAGAVALLVAGRTRLGGGVLGLAFAAKLYPAVLLPLAVAYAWRRGRREGLWCAGAFLIGALAVFLPFFVLSPDGVWDSVTRQTSRPLQIETLGSGFLLVLHHVAGLGITMSSGHGSQNLAGTLPDGLAALQTVVQLAVVAAIWVWFARGPRDAERLVTACAAAVAAFIAFGKVLSPQFLVWLIPLVPLVRGRRGLAAGGMLALALVLTQLWFPYRYWELALEFDTLASWLVLLRDLTLLALVAVLVWPSSPRRRRATA